MEPRKRLIFCRERKAGKGTLLVAAIDFGTAFSGCAFSFKYEFESDPTRVSTRNVAGDRLSMKAPTCILIKPDGRTVHSFGYEAESYYMELLADEEHTQWYFFRRFKMMLFNKQGLGRNEFLKDESGKELPAKTVFCLSIKHLKDDLISVCESRISRGGLSSNDIFWVLTVPAIWNDAAKQFMREAAQEAGIKDDMLAIALEPEAASLYCRHLPVEKCGADNVSLASLASGKRYLVLDAGGGTVDITVHEVSESQRLKELLKASGGAWGGTKVDEAFVDFLTDLMGFEGLNKLKEAYTEEFLDMMKDFEMKKRELDPRKQNKMSIKISTAVREILKERYNQTLEERVKSTSYESKVKCTGDKMRLDHVLASSFFQPSVDSVISHVRSLLQDPRSEGVEAILMVGGFSESLILQNAVRGSFPAHRIIIPDEPSLTVLKGAVIFGHNPSAITQRISKFTYGTDVVLDETSLLTDNVFSTLVKAGQVLEIGKAEEEHSFLTLDETQSEMGMDNYATLNENPKFVDEVGCHRIGKFSVPVAGTGKGRKVTVRMIFGGTEIDVECTDDATKHTTHLKVDFLS